MSSIETVKRMNFVEFLEAMAPSTWVIVDDMVNSAREVLGYTARYPDISLHCSNERCGGKRIYRTRTLGKGPLIKNEGATDFILRYICSNCHSSEKVFSLLGQFDENAGDHYCYKFGEIPPYGPQTPTKLMKLVGEDRENFFKGRKCEFQGLGIGAFTYYRRVVENQKNRIIDEIIKVSQRVSAEENVIKGLEQAKNTFKFSQAIDTIKPAIPESLKVGGHNPLALLHSALSDGIHDGDDAHCLELASSIRVVLGELAERIDMALKDERELNDALAKLMKVKQK